MKSIIFKKTQTLMKNHLGKKLYFYSSKLFSACNLISETNCLEANLFDFKSKKFDYTENFIPKSYLDLNDQIKDIVIFDDDKSFCFTNEVYVKRKQEIQKFALKYNIKDKAPFIKYLSIEDKCWNAVASKVFPKIAANCCEEFAESFQVLQKEANLVDNKVRLL